MILENNLYNAEESNIFLKGEAKSKFRTLIEEKNHSVFSHNEITVTFFKKQLKLTQGSCRVLGSKKEHKY